MKCMHIDALFEQYSIYFPAVVYRPHMAHWTARECDDKCRTALMSVIHSTQSWKRKRTTESRIQFSDIRCVFIDNINNTEKTSDGEHILSVLMWGFVYFCLRGAKCLLSVGFHTQKYEALQNNSGNNHHLLFMTNVFKAAWCWLLPQCLVYELDIIHRLPVEFQWIQCDGFLQTVNS